MRRAVISSVTLAMKGVLVCITSISLVVILAGCGAFATTTPTATPTTPPTVSPDLLKIDAIETRMQDACDDFIRQQATLAAEGAYDLDEMSSDELPDAALSLQVEHAYSEALAAFDGMDADSPNADAVRSMITRIAPMQRHAMQWGDALMATFEMIGEGLVTEANVLTIGPLPEWRNRAVELCASW